MKHYVHRTLQLGAAFSLAAAWQAHAHDPVFGLGPHTLFKGGTELHIGTFRQERGEETETELALALKYGLTGDWVIGIELPYLDISEPGASRSGGGDIALSTKYRFWRNDQPGVQESMAVALTTVLNTTTEDLGGGATDTVAGLSYGYEGRKWYRWAAIRYRHNGENDAGLKRGDKVLIDLVGGIRPDPTGYLEPDLVWMLELNGEFTQRAQRGGVTLPNTGGQEWFVSPGLMWTYRNYAVKAGVQIPIASNLNGTQPDTDYRAALDFEGHF